MYVFISSYPEEGSVCHLMPHDVWPPLSGANVCSHTEKTWSAERRHTRTSGKQSHQGKRREKKNWVTGPMLTCTLELRLLSIYKEWCYKRGKWPGYFCVLLQSCCSKKVENIFYFLLFFLTDFAAVWSPSERICELAQTGNSQQYRAVINQSESFINLRLFSTNSLCPWNLL